MRSLWVAGGFVGLAATGLLVWPDLLPGGPLLARGIAAGALVGTAGSLAGFLLVASQRTAGVQRFQVALFGGMLLRLLIFGLALVAVLVREAASVKGFLAGLIPTYLVFQALEIGHLHRSMSHPVRGPGESGAARESR